MARNCIRNVDKGNSAKEYIIHTKRTDPDAIKIWHLDLEKTNSTLAFAERAKNLPRLDDLVQNAGINEMSWTVSGGFERNI